MRIALAQLNPVVGDIVSNTADIIDALDEARGHHADVVVFSELAVIGYPPRDLLLRSGVVEAAEHAVLEIARAGADVIVCIGHPRRAPGPRGVRNSVSVCADGRVIAVYDKQLLPGYDVFDEDRYFDPGDEPGLVEVGGTRFGILCCEDLWRADDASSDVVYPVDPVATLAAHRPDVTVVLNASPFVIGKNQRHIDLIQEAARRLHTPVVSVNEVGANDDLIFDGRSIIVNAQGAVIASLPGWRPCVRVVDPAGPPSPPDLNAAAPEEDVFRALVLGTGDYVRKTGHQRVIIGLSGGIDSALTATIAAAALGSENITGVMMPSRYSSSGSIDDAMALAANLGIGRLLELPVRDVHDAAVNTMQALKCVSLDGLPDENLQSRLRGLLLMAVSNATGALVLATGNKSELAVGYTTLYGDMCGAVSVIGDVLKTQVYDIARWINANHGLLDFDCPPIPDASISKPPSAELRHDQSDQDTLPPYALLDAIITRYVDHEQSVDQMIADMPDTDPATIRRWTAAIDRAQYKRNQAAVILKVSSRTFGRGRPYPIVMRDTSAAVVAGGVAETS